MSCIPSNGVKITFFYYPFNLEFSKNFDKYAKLPDPLTLAAMKAYALGRRSKWKDYVDLFFISKKHSLSAIIKKSRQIFGKEFNEKNFRAQLSYFKDIDRSENIIYRPGYKVSDEIIKKNFVNSV